jgi:hypothetical protein
MVDHVDACSPLMYRSFSATHAPMSYHHTLSAVPTPGIAGLMNNAPVSVASLVHFHHFTFRRNALARHGKVFSDFANRNR